MGKYLTEFSSNTEYNAALATLDFPNVSLVANELKYAESLPTMYRWVDDGDNTICGDDDEHEGEWRDSCTLYQQTKKQMSINGGQTWSDVVPAEYGYGDVIEEDSQECGCGEESCDTIGGNDYNGELVQGFYASSPQAKTFYIWDYNYDDVYIGKVEIVYDDLEDTWNADIYDGDGEMTGEENAEDWVALCSHFSGTCMKISSSDSDSNEHSNLNGLMFAIDWSGEKCDCDCIQSE